MGPCHCVHKGSPSWVPRLSRPGGEESDQQAAGGGQPKAFADSATSKVMVTFHREALTRTMPHPGWAGSGFPRSQGIPLQTVPFWVSWSHSGSAMSDLGDGLIVQLLRQQMVIKFRLYSRFRAQGGMEQD